MRHRTPNSPRRRALVASVPWAALAALPSLAALASLPQARAQGGAAPGPLRIWVDAPPGAQLVRYSGAKPE